MSVPFFYIESYDASAKTIVLDEDTSRHVVSVLRMQEGERLNLTDGKGTLLNCAIIDAHKKHCLVKVDGTRHKEQGTREVSIAISLIKNTSRFEWFLEKATEIGVTEIIPLICERTEKQKFRFDRMKGICISAMLQSQQTSLPVLHEPVRLADLLIRRLADEQKFIAHCIETEKQSVSHQLIRTSAHQLIIIGPEGDFTSAEINLALENNFIPVTLGETRLRTETAGIVAATLLRNI
jgi:16S rRNA (uracil1498-N3)-methyltransferase